MTLDTEKNEFITLLTNLKGKTEVLTETNIERSIKKVEISEEARNEGNALFNKGFHSAEEHEKIFRLYCKSVASAPVKSDELAQAYGARSAFLIHIEKFEDCIKDIDRAVGVTLSNVQKVELLCRKLKCLSALRQFEDGSILDEIEILIDAISEDDEIRKTLLSLFKESKTSFAKRRLNNKKRRITKEESFKTKKKLERKEELFDSVKVNFNEKYGRHLIATRDIEPGEIIFVEKLYASCLNEQEQHINCENCFAICWSGIPCDTCTWAMFYSKECKEEAMKNYHDIECSVVQCARALKPIMTLWNVHICIRLLVLALKESGGIEKLKKEVEAMDKIISTSGQDYITSNGVQNNFATVYNLSTNSNKEQLQAHAAGTPYLMMSIAKHTDFFGKTMQSCTIEDFLENEDFIFIGALFMRLKKISLTNAHLICNDVIGESGSLIPEKYTGTGLGLHASLMNHSCVPNVHRCFTKDNKLIVYATKPIQENSQLFDNYFGSHFNVPKMDRQKHLDYYNIMCDCPACLNDWPWQPTITTPITNFSVFFKEQKLIEIIEKWKPTIDDFSKCDYAAVEELSDAVKLAYQNLPPSSWITCVLSVFLGQAFNKIYCLEEKIAEKCMNRK